MNDTVVIPAPIWSEMCAFNPNGRESAGIALAGLVTTQTSKRRLLVQSIAIPSESDYDERTNVSAVLGASFLAPIVADARARGLSVIFFHTHPFSKDAAFSPIDDKGELILRDFLERRIPGRPHVAVVVGQQRHQARLIGTTTSCDLEVVGAQTQIWRTGGSQHPRAETSHSTFDRQIRVFGRAAQAVLSRLRVAIVGLGGTGTVVAQELAHLGVARFLLMDPDVVEESNLNRVVGAEPADSGGAQKVDVAARMIRRIRPDVELELSTGSVLTQRDTRRLLDVDAIFACTDSHGSRYVLNQLAYQFLVPVIDIGVVIVAANNDITHVFGRTQLLAPGLACLTCARTLDPEQVRRDLLSDFERQQDPYIVGAPAEPQPAVISLNAAVSSLAVTLFLATFAGVPVVPRHQVYDALRGMVRPVADPPVPGCVTCSSDGAFAQGDAWPMPGRAA